MSVQAIFYVKEVKHQYTGMPDANVAQVDLGAAFGSYLQGLADDNIANKDWSKYTPNGELKLTITNPAAIDEFSPGDVFEITMRKLEKKPA